MDLSLLVRFCEERGFPLSDEQVSRFLEFREELYRQNQVMNLTRVTPEDCELRHFVDSLLVAELLPNGALVLDLGTGPGLPAWPLACARPDLKVTAMDSTAKMLTVMEHVTLSNLRVRQHRAEDVDSREHYDVVTGRAVAPLEVQLELSAAWAKVGGLVVPFRTPSDALPIERFKGFGLGLCLERVESRNLPNIEATRLFPVYRKAERTEKTYPRKWAQIKSRPLV